MSTSGDPASFQVEELDQAGLVVTRYVASANGRVDVIIPENSKSHAKEFLAAFLPAGYPQSVTEDYLEYQVYDSLQAFSSSIAGLLASRAVLEGVGVGDANASPTAAILLSVLQDSMGRIATILFAHKLGTALEPECKMYRLAADFFNDAAMILDCVSPAFSKPSRVVLLSFSSTLRALCGVTGSSSKASLSAHFAKQGNLAELNAKDSSQETIISLLGMLAGSLIVSRVMTRSATWLTLMFLITIHLWTNYRAVRAVSMRTLNRQRANIIFSTYMELLGDRKSYAIGRKLRPIKGQQVEQVEQEEMKNLLPSPKEVSLLERIFEIDGVLRWQGSVIIGHCVLGVSLKDILNGLPVFTRHPTTGSYNPVNSEGRNQDSTEIAHRDESFKELLGLFADEDYILSYSMDMTRFSRARRPRFSIVLKEASNAKTQVKSWFHAFLCARKLYTTPEILEQPVLSVLEQTLIEVRRCWPGIQVSLEEAGWDLNIGALETRSGVRLIIESEGRELL